jgi:hypothetical protein
MANNELPFSIIDVPNEKRDVITQLANMIKSQNGGQILQAPQTKYAKQFGNMIYIVDNEYNVLYVDKHVIGTYDEYLTIVVQVINKLKCPISPALKDALFPVYQMARKQFDLLSENTKTWLINNIK